MPSTSRTIIRDDVVETVPIDVKVDPSSRQGERVDVEGSADAHGVDLAGLRREALGEVVIHELQLGPVAVEERDDVAGIEEVESASALAC